MRFTLQLPLHGFFTGSGSFFSVPYTLTAISLITGGEGYNVPNVVCDIYFDGKHPCLGGLLALDGRSGREIWRHYAPHEIFSVTCEGDLNEDGQNDCVIAGRVGVGCSLKSVTSFCYFYEWPYAALERDLILHALVEPWWLILSTVYDPCPSVVEKQ